ncbi:MAG: LamB/YcsF family protein [Acetomicrobium sp.]|nr:LamB/YcsF family protein [Acetomicrobium sp.]
MYAIDLNSDLGESFGAWKMGNDDAVLQFVSSANIACGFHAGDPVVLLSTVRAAKEKGVAIGAHPGYPDLIGFGRRNMEVTPDEVYAYTLYQIGAVQAACHAVGAKLQHVKAHGALYNQAAKNRALAVAIAQAVKDAGQGLILLGLANSEFDNAAAEVGVPYAAEAFADRAYQADGTLVPRKVQGSMIHDVSLAVARVVRMVKEGKVETIDGHVIDLKPHSICLHGDSPKAVQMATEIRKGLQAAGIKIMPISEVIRR